MVKSFEDRTDYTIVQNGLRCSAVDFFTLSLMSEANTETLVWYQ